ncbi:MAG TPA: 50S ribosomal protein L11 methyltransferase [Gaiellaceae bacterium]|nr:50S ribosomal protein L11 methyltransferase [Gaiellaceae bacterium]
MIELFPQGFEEVDRPEGVELAAYTDAAGEERLWAFFGGVRSADVEGGWEEKWRAFHRPVRVGGLWVGPPWEEPDAGLLAVVIDPGRAFGTGSHPTTQLCLRALQELDRGPLLDVGCGSGVLSIAAAMLGHAPVTAVDTDEASVEATRENAERNGVAVDVRLVGADEPLPATAVAVANISFDAVLALPERLDAQLLVTSGYLLTDEPALAGYEHVRRRTLDGWAADLHRLPL